MLSTNRNKLLFFPSDAICLSIIFIYLDYLIFYVICGWLYDTSGYWSEIFVCFGNPNECEDNVFPIVQPVKETPVIDGFLDICLVMQDFYFFWLLAWTNCWTNGSDVSGLRHHDTHVTSLSYIRWYMLYSNVAKSVSMRLWSIWSDSARVATEW